MIGNDFQEKLHIKFQEKNINYIALISIDFQEKLHLRFREENISFTALISLDFQEKLPSQISRGKHQLHSIDTYKLQEKLHIKFQKENMNFDTVYFCIMFTLLVQPLSVYREG
jgi:hypothetical protein